MNKPTHARPIVVISHTRSPYCGIIPTGSIDDNSGFNSSSGSSAHSALAQQVVVAKRDHVADWLVAQEICCC